VSRLAGAHPPSSNLASPMPPILTSFQIEINGKAILRYGIPLQNENRRTREIGYRVRWQTGRNFL